MQSIGNGTRNTPAAVLDDSELLSLVIDKHLRFNEEYGSELESMKEKVDNKRSEYDRITGELETIENRMVVLKEKRHQLYYQARKLRLKLIKTVNDPQKVSNFEKGIENIENRLQNAVLSFTEEINNIDRINSLLSELESDMPDMNNEQRMISSSIADILDMAKAARKELKEMENSPDKLKTDSDLLRKEFEEMETRMGWLTRRLDLHRAAREHWEKVRKGADHGG